MIPALWVINLSKRFPELDTWAPILSAVNIQLLRDVAPLLGLVPSQIKYFSTSGTYSRDAVIVEILDAADAPGALGYHSETTAGRAYAKVFLDPILSNGGAFSQGANSVSATLSHEVVELVGDEHANRWVLNDADGCDYALELADPVECDEGYDINGIGLSNFVTDAWFSAGSHPKSRFDFLSRLNAPFTMTPGGFMLRRRGAQDLTTYGALYPSWRQELKKANGRPGRRWLRG